MTSVRPRNDTDHIRGMMPSFVGWQDAQTTLAAEHEAARRGRARQQQQDGGRRARPHRRWPWLVALAVVAAVAVVVVTGGQADDAAAPTVNTPVAELPWRVVETPSGSLRVDLPAQPDAGAISSIAGRGQQLHAEIPGYDITVAEFALSRGPNEARNMVAPLLRERADLLNGHEDMVTVVSSRVGQAFEGVLVSSGPVGIVRVVVDGSSLYLLEIRGDAESARARQIFERVVQGFTPTRTR